MSFSWSTSSSPSFAGIKPASTNSFADALKRLAEHVEEKNKNIDANNIGNSSLVQSSIDFPNRMFSCHVNNSMSPEQTLRLYTQYIHEIERREDMRRRYLRVYGGSNGPSINLPILNRRSDVIDPYRFTAPHLSSLLHSPAYLQLLTQPTRLTQPAPFSLTNVKTIDTTPRIPIQENTDKKSSEQISQLSKPKLKLFRPYDLDTPNSNSHQASPSSPNVTKKSTLSPSTCSNSNLTISDESQQTVSSSGKEKQLFNTLGLVQQSTDLLTEKSSLIETVPLEDSTSNETVFTQEDNRLDNILSNTKDSSLFVTLKRKSVFSSNTQNSPNRKQSKIDKIHNAVE
ncbi:unnamed protein product [Rotaria sp. Silwood1]|nr:unnamed protein product [Rotaria sp. Silwood1]CAF3355164.1 unnamed protein product [Rotaria sp. Silwood1]CAF4533784.1 unnamed protein product [Rotaria sp. Silwood1]CAF4613182.1 unnamed protein product [Rotaria sp. Silwood1]